MYKHGYTSPKTIIFDLVKNLCVGYNSTTSIPEEYNRNWKLVYPMTALFGADPSTLTTEASKKALIDSYPNFWNDKVIPGTGGNPDTLAPSATEQNMIDFEAHFEQFKANSTTEERSLYKALTRDDVNPMTQNDAVTAVLQCRTRLVKKWVKKLVINVKELSDASSDRVKDNSDGTITVALEYEGKSCYIAEGGNIRVMIQGKKYSLYRVSDRKEVSVIEFFIDDKVRPEEKLATSPINLRDKLILPSSAKTAVLSIDIEIDLPKSQKVEYNNYYVQFARPLKVALYNDTAVDGKNNYFYLTWRQGDKFDILKGLTDEPYQAWGGYPMNQETKWSWYKCNQTTVGYVQNWLPIEYWLAIDGDSMVGVIMGDPGMSSTDYLSSPAYFGSLEQIEGALETDDKGNFACFSGSDQNPQMRNKYADDRDNIASSGGIERLKLYGDYTATGITDVMLTSSKSGRPYQGHKLGLFGMYEFKEQTFNGLSSHTNKHAVTDIVVSDVHENERGILKNCLGVPKLGKEHGVELVADRYMSGKERTYIFLHINSLYTPFNTGNDVLIGMAIRTDI